MRRPVWRILSGSVWSSGYSIMVGLSACEGIVNVEAS